MSGTAKVKTPKNDQEWARNTQKRLESVENPTSIRVGEWVISTSADSGNLIASHNEGGSVVLATKPAASQNPDDVVDNSVPYIKLERQSNQAAPRGSVQLVNWDTVQAQTRDWGFSAPGTDLDIPVNGVYEIKYHLAFLNSSSTLSKAVFFINGTVVMAQEEEPDSNSWWISFYMTDTFTLNAGDTISAGAYVAGSGTMDFGSSGADPTVHTSMSVFLISKEEGDS